MPSETLIRSLRAQPLDIALHAPFGISGGSLDTARNVLVTVELADSTIGIGEGAPFPAFNGETQEGVLQAVHRFLPEVEGSDAANWRRIARRMAELDAGNACARCAIETAILDALTRRAGLSLQSWFGGAGTVLHSDMTVTTGNIEQARLSARDIASRGFRTCKIKVGSGNLDLDINRVIAIHQEYPSASLLLDGNAGFTASDAVALTLALRSHGVVPDLWEQPVAGDDWDGLRQVAEATGVPVAADESATNARAVAGLLAGHHVQVVNIKLMKSGIVEALDIAAVCRANGAGLMIGGMVESILAMTVSACFAAGLGGFSFVDLDTPLFMLGAPFAGGWEMSGDRIDVSQITSGHGVAFTGASAQGARPDA